MNNDHGKPIIKATLVLSLIFIVTYIMMLIAFTRNSFTGIVFTSETGVIGDTIGGIAGPIVAFLGVLITFYAFYIQYEANVEQKKQFKKQENDLKIERFENRFFELIKIHRENVAEISITGRSGDVTSRKALISMFNEFRVAYHVSHELIKENKKYNLTETDIVNISFVLFYIGIGTNSNNLSLELLSKYDAKLVKSIINKLEAYKTSDFCNEHGQYKIKISANKGLPEIEVRFWYKPFGGHITRLGHYYRHIWTTIKYLDEQDDEFIPNKYEYVKIYRAQISSFEQLLLHYNALTDLGREWHKTNLLTKYKLTRNIPIPLAYFGPKLSSIYTEPNYFEWEEHLNMENY